MKKNNAGKPKAIKSRRVFQSPSIHVPSDLPSFLVSYLSTDHLFTEYLPNAYHMIGTLLMCYCLIFATTILFGQLFYK